LSFTKFSEAAFLRSPMSFLRFACPFAILLTILAAAQSNPVLRVDQENAPRDIQKPPVGVAARQGPAKQAQPVRFKNPVIYDSLGRYADSVAIGDLNGDGKPDLVVANACPCGDGVGPISVLLGNGDGTFQPAIGYDPGGEESFSVAIGDVNGDGKPDLIVATLCGPDVCLEPYPGGVSVLLGNGDGTFQPAVSYSSGGYTRGDTRAFVVIRDVNGDGKPDLIVSSECQSADNCNSPTGPGGVTVLLGNGDGTFQPPVSFSSGGNFGYWVAIGDVNGDSHPDLVVVNGCGNIRCTANLAVFLGNGDGTFQHPVVYDGQPGATSAVIADLNGDGHLDLALSGTCNECRETVGVMPGNGDGSFQPPVNFLAGGYRRSSPVAIGDVNHDGRPDLVVGNDCSVTEKFGYCPTNGTVGVLVNNFSANTATALTSSPNPSQVNQSVTFTATVTSSTSLPPNGSTVNFYNHQTKIGSGTTTNGVASFTTVLSKAGTTTYKAVYPGDVFHKSSSGTTTQVVNP
jgi:FG-GAP-like repeat/Bacterial Ig-like domain (group 3)